MANESLYKTVDCPICGKNVLLPFFTDLEHYVYKIPWKSGYRRVCSYKCLCEAKRKAAAKATAKNKNNKNNI